jgi:rod shape-determining protein MreC
LRHKLYLALCCGVLIAVMAILPASVNRRMRWALGDVFSPFASFVHDVPGFVAGILRDRRRLLAENEKMAIELERIRHEMLHLRSLEEENRKLRDMLRLAEESPHELVPGRVVARNVSGWWRKVRLDIGREHGVEPDMPVVSGLGLVGRTASVSSRRSDVLLMIDPSFRISARIPASDAFGIVRGHGISSRDDHPLCLMEYVSRGARMRPGDEVVTSGLGGVYPPGIVVGRVRSVHVDQSGLYQKADILPATDFRSLDIVFVVLSGEGRQR